MRLMLALKKMGVLRESVPPFSDTEQRFEQRFARFHTLVTVPEPYSYADFASSTDVSTFAAEALLTLAVEAFDLARKAIGYEAQVVGHMQHSQQQQQQLPSTPIQVLHDLDKVAISNMLASSVLAKAAKADGGGTGGMAVTADNFSRHPHFPVVGVKSEKVVGVKSEKR
ncbi:hypothetical protein FOA52_005926 [Chlamydomonas sp. UWO 241]|nr:hypothetical protein FOA52_005926 [Chlamydomonas sp. UWO 241]